MVDALMRLRDLDGARRLIATIPPTSASHLPACAKSVLIGILADDVDETRAAIDRIGTRGDGVYAAAYGAAAATLEADADPLPLPPGVDRAAVFAVLVELAGTLLELGALERFNGIVPLLYATSPDHRDVDRRLGYLLYVNDFPDPAADRLLAAVRAGDESPDAFAALGRICQSKHLDDDAETFLRAALETRLPEHDAPPRPGGPARRPRALRRRRRGAARGPARVPALQRAARAAPVDVPAGDLEGLASSFSARTPILRGNPGDGDRAIGVA